MKKNFINKDKLKKIGGVVLVASMLAAPVSGLAQSYTVQPGDTLKRISQDFYGRNDYYDEIAYLNNISDPNMIRAGDVIYLPNDYRELEFCGQDDKWVSNDILYYTFGPKDNLWNLADKFYGDGRYWKCLADYNGITNPKKIRDGKVIQIPPFSYLNMDALNYTFEGDSNTNNQSSPSIRSHTFVEGDTLWALASKYYGNGNYWEPLATYNNISNPRKISNGTVVYLPSKNVLKDIKNGNYVLDLYTISKQNYGTSRYAGYLAYVNGVALHGDFRVGDLKIPKMEEIKNVDASEYQTDGYYVVKKGDTFKKIAELVYDDPNFADYLKEVNGITSLQEGMKIFIPVVGYSYSK